MTLTEEDQIRRWHAEGISNREIAKRMAISHVSVAKILKRLAPLEAAPLPAHMARPAPGLHADDDEPDDDAPAIEQLRYLMRQARDGLRAANANCDPQLAQRQTRNASFLANVLARLEASENDKTESVPVAECLLAEATIDGRLQALADREGIRCIDCDRVLSVKWGTGE